MSINETDAGNAQQLYAKQIGALGQSRDDGHLSFSRNDGAAMVTIQRSLRPDLARRIEAVLKDILADDERQQVSEKELAYRQAVDRQQTLRRGFATAAPDDPRVPKGTLNY